MKKVLLFLLVVSVPLWAEMKIYERLGDVPETADIYQTQSGDSVIFVDANSLSPEYRNRITKNPEFFQKVDMSQVKKGKSVTTQGVISYEKDWYAKEESDLYKLSEKDMFIDVETVAEDKRTKITENKAFTKIGKVQKIEKEKVEKIEDSIMKMLEKTIGTKDELLEKYGTEKAGLAVQKYEKEMGKVKGEVLVAINDLIGSYTKKGDLENIKKYSSVKEEFISNDDIELLAEETDSKVKRAYNNYLVVQKREAKTAISVLEKEKSEQVRKGNINIAEKIDGVMVTIPDETRPEKLDVYISVNNTYELFINGKKIGSGNIWERLDTYKISVKKGDIISIKATDCQDGKNTAGFFVCIKNHDKIITHSGDGKWFYTITESKTWNLSTSTNNWKIPQRSNIWSGHTTQTHLNIDSGYVWSEEKSTIVYFKYIF